MEFILLHFEGFLFLAAFLIVSLGLGLALRRQQPQIPHQPKTDETIIAKPAAETKAELASTVDEGAPSRTVAEALKNTEKSFWGRLRGLFSDGGSRPDLEAIEEILYTSDLGPKTVVKVMSDLEDLSSTERANPSVLQSKLRLTLSGIFNQAQPAPRWEPTAGVQVIMVVGVNGAGKTTSIGKLASYSAKAGKKVMVIAGDTFRAAAVQQLKVWTDRAGVEVFAPENVTDPAAVAFDGLTKAVAQGSEVVIVDTAGRLHTSAPLMEELKKVKRVLARVVPEAPHQTLIVLDANSGQNALIQAREFHDALGLSGVVLTKLDGTAKGGVAFGIVDELKIPIQWIGIGEKLGDLKAFDASEFVDSILPSSERAGSPPN